MKRLILFIVMALLPVFGYAQLPWKIVELNVGTSISDSKYISVAGNFTYDFPVGDNFAIGGGVRLSSDNYNIKDFTKGEFISFGFYLDAKGHLPVNDKNRIIVDGKLGVVGGNPNLKEETASTVTKYKAMLAGPYKSIGVGYLFPMYDGGISLGLYVDRYDYDLTAPGESKIDLEGITCVCLRLDFYFL